MRNWQRWPSDMPPAAIKTGLLGSAANLRMLAAWIDRLRQADPALALVVDPVLRSSTGASFADEELLQAYRNELLPRATVATPNRAEAAASAGHCRAAGSRRRGAGREAALREMGCQAVAITGGDSNGDCSDDYASTPHASGWLSLPRVATRHNHGTGCVFASSAAAALASGFVAIEALVLAKMATTHALRHGWAAGAGAGPVRPRGDFALHAGNLPGFSIPGQDRVASFAPLADPALGPLRNRRQRGLGAPGARCRRAHSAAARQGPERIPRRFARKFAKAWPRPAPRAPSFSSTTTGRWPSRKALTVCTWDRKTSHGDLAATANAGLRLGLSTHAYGR